MKYVDPENEIDQFAPYIPPGTASTRWAVVAATIALVAIPLLWALVPVEVSRWYQAAAVEAELDEDLDAAMAALDRAISWCQTDYRLYMSRSQLWLEQRQLDAALDDANRAVELASDDEIQPRIARFLVFQRRGEHDLALQECDRIVQLVSDLPPWRRDWPGGNRIPTFDQALNMRAYARALANREIESGLADIENAITRLGDQIEPAYLDTRGYLHFLAGNFELAERDLQQAVELSERTLGAFQASTAQEDPRMRQHTQRLLEENLAVMYHHRGLVLEKLGDQEQASTDFARANELGYSPEDGVW